MKLPAQDHIEKMTEDSSLGQGETIEHLSLGLLDSKVFVSKNQMARKVAFVHSDVSYKVLHFVPDVYRNLKN